MGQNQSSEKPAPATAKDNRINRRKSIQKLQTRSQPARVAFTPATAPGETTHEKTPLPNSTSPESIPQKTTGDAATASASVAIPSAISKTRSRQEELVDAQYGSYAPVSRHRPPRFPIAIADAPMPDSPSLGPVRPADDVPFFHDDHILERKDSMLSQDTQDEDVGDELMPFGVDPAGGVVPWEIVWHGSADKVFVTGTFSGWDRKYRLKKDDSGVFKTTISLPPGTHHVKFFVDGQMMTSSDLPTAVDFNNILVNYIEIGLDDIPNARRESSNTKRPQLPISPQTEEQIDPISGTVTPGDHDQEVDEIAGPDLPQGDFRQLIPQALTDIDSVAEDDPRYKQAAQVIQDSQAPPSLPMFLSRSILNGNVPIKDDSSVLPLPNHTVLNHLMTSSVRNGVLATSVTCRYKKKVSRLWQTFEMCDLMPCST